MTDDASRRHFASRLRLQLGGAAYMVAADRFGPEAIVFALVSAAALVVTYISDSRPQARTDGWASSVHAPVKVDLDPGISGLEQRVGRR